MRPEFDCVRLRAVQVHPMLSSTLAYAERFASVKNPNVTEEIRKCAPATQLLASDSGCKGTLTSVD